MNEQPDTVGDHKLTPVVVNIPPRGRPQFAKNALSLSIAAALAAGMPPRAETLAKTIVEPTPKSPERLAAAQSRRERRNQKRLRHAVASKGGSV